jgi:hypothetical protein
MCNATPDAAGQIKGGPVDVKSGTNIYVVEIWQTASLASRAAITNLNQLQERFRTSGVVTVGISDEPVDKIKAFMQHDAGTNIKYAIAADDERQTSLAYMRPVGQRGVPRAFVVGTNGVLLWHGHPFYGLDQALAQITTGQYDLEQAAKLDSANHLTLEYLAMARRGDPRTRGVGLDVLSHRTNDAALLCDLALKIATTPQLAKRDFALANAALDQAERLKSTNTTRIHLDRAIVLFESGRRDDGLTLATQVLATAQSPEERTNVQSCLDFMHARLAAIKAAPVNTNAGHAWPSPAPAPGRPSTGNTNPPPAK